MSYDVFIEAPQKGYDDALYPLQNRRLSAGVHD